MNHLVLSTGLVLAVASGVRGELIFTVSPGGPSGLPSQIVFARGPIEVAGGLASGLVAADVINGFSQPQGLEEFLLCFSVDPATVGAAAPADGYPGLNVTHQAALGQAAGDGFVTTIAFTRAGPVGGAAALGGGNNVLALNQSPRYTGGDFGILPDALPEEPISDCIDDVGGGGSGTPGGITSLFYVFAPGSPKLAGGSSADVFFDPTAGRGSGIAGDESLFASAADLGLVSGLVGDVIDALTVFDDDADGVWSGTDQIIFSLAPGSPTLGALGASPADFLTVTVGEDPALFVGASDIGLLDSDDVNMLELVPLIGPVARTIREKLDLCPADLDGSCRIDVADLTSVVLAWGGEGPAGDVVTDGLVNVQDLVEVITTWGECPGCDDFGCPGRGDCLDDHGSPGCQDFDCCVLVCTKDAFCCDVAWDALCAELADGLCDPCAGGAGDCFEPDGLPGCGEPTCCGAVCAIDLYCCAVGWDEICVNEAHRLCQPCDLTCAPRDVVEPEPCGADENGGCNLTPAVFELSECGLSWCGTAWAEGGVRDTDWYLFFAPPGETVATLESEFPGVVFLLDVNQGQCFDLAILGQIGSSLNCAPGAAIANLEPGLYVAFVSVGDADGGGIFDGFPCDGGLNEYRLAVECTDKP